MIEERGTVVLAAYLAPILALCGVHGEAASLFGAWLGLILALRWLRGYRAATACTPLIPRRLEFNQRIHL